MKLALEKREGAHGVACIGNTNCMRCRDVLLNDELNTLFMVIKAALG